MTGRFGWVDCHSHVLPGVDDGSTDLAMSLTMMADAARGGTRLLFATPHLDARFPASPERLAMLHDRFEQLVDGMGDLPNAPELRLGFEVAPRPGSCELTDDPSTYALPGTDAVLVDGPDDEPMPHDPTLEAYLQRVVGLGLRPILAHPERHAATHPGDHWWAERLKGLGAVLQLDSGAFFGVDGAAVQTEAFRLLDAGLADVIASDTHELGEADLGPVHSMLLQRLGSTADGLLNGSALGLS